MSKLLVNAPTGKQELIEVGEGGGYFDPSRVLWDERTDGELPAITLGGMVRSGDSLVFNQARMDEHSTSVLGPLKATLAAKVDAHIAGIYDKWMRFEAEYVEREAAARAFKAGGYQGDPGVWVTSFATSAGKTNQQAADLIISQADGLRTALQNLAALRMRKYSVLGAATAAAAQSSYDTIIAQADAIAGSLV